MSKVLIVLLTIFVSVAFVGCNSGEVTESDAKAYQNAGRDADDPPIDPNTGQPVENN